MVELDKDLLSRLESRALSLEELQEQESQCVVRKFDHEDAYQLGSLVRRAAMELFPGKAVVIDVSLVSRHTLFRTVTGAGSGPDNDEWVRRKQNTALRFGHSTFFMGCKKGDVSPEDRFFVDSKEYAFHGGAVPIRLESAGFPVACLTVSGLKQHEDHFLAVSCIKEYAAGGVADELSLD